MSRSRWSATAVTIARGATATIALLLVAAVGVVSIGLARGYRPVIITTGSMGETAPPGSLLVAKPASDVEVGDILVMRRDGRATITHRVVEIEMNQAGEPFAVTRGDANVEIDAAPYRIDSSELTGQWVVPGLGRVLVLMGSPMLGIGVLTAAVMAIVATALRRIWGSSRSSGRRRPTGEASSRLRRVGVATMVGVLLSGAGVAWSLYVGVDAVGGNVFSTSDCYDARLGGVQSGQLTNTSNGVETVGISAVDPTASFLLFSVRSDSNEPDESQLMGRLVDATTIEFVRQSDSGSPPAIAVEWSVVEYGCGVSVQRGVVAGDGSSQIDLPITSIDRGSSFVLGSSAPQPGATEFDHDDLQIYELIADDTLRVRSSGSPLDPSRQLAWQVVTFTDPGDAVVKTVSTTLTAGIGSASISLTTPVDPSSSFVLAALVSSSTGPEIGERMVRVNLADATTVDVSRLVATESVEVSLQVVELLDGSMVQHGVVDLNPAQAIATPTIKPVDVARSTVFSTVMMPGSQSAGATDHVTDDTVGEASATLRLTDAVTVAVRRSASVSAASFPWQVVTWGGPAWADPLSPFRQRIDITAGGVDAPTGYTTPLTFDHESLVDGGLALASGDDARVWRYDGASWTELDRVLDEGSGWNAIDTTFWFRTQESITATETVSYWLYFGNSTPPPTLADPANVWLLLEGFESGTLGVFEDRTAGGGWYRALPWTRRMMVTIDSGEVGSDLTAQPVLVRVTDADLGATAQLDGSDIRFTAADGTTVLSHEIEDWDALSGTLTAWVQVPLVSSASDTTLNLYYGAADAPGHARPRQVWTGELAAWHLSRDPSGPAPTLDDSGPYQRDGLALADTALVATGSGPAATLDGVTDRLEAAPADLPDGPLTVAAWFRADSLGTDPVVVSQGDPTVAGVFELGIDTTTTPGSPAGRLRLRAGGSLASISGGLINIGTWHHLAATWDGVTASLYLDGSPIGSVTAAGSTPDGSAMPIVLGGDSAGTRTLAGLLGQVRLSPEVWTPAELAFADSNLRNPTTTVDVSAPTTGTWFDQGVWTVRRPLTVDATQVTGALSDYPLLVQLVDAGLAANAQADGDDLVFVGGDGVTRLDHELESWNPATGAVTAWVRLPVLDDVVDTEFFLYAGNPSAIDQTDPVGVWGLDADLVLNG